MLFLSLFGARFKDSSFNCRINFPACSDHEKSVQKNTKKRLKKCFFSHFLAPGSKIRLVTLDATIDLLKGMVLQTDPAQLPAGASQPPLDKSAMLPNKDGLLPNSKSFMADTHFAQLEGIKEESTLLLRNFYKVIVLLLKIYSDSIPVG